MEYEIPIIAIDTSLLLKIKEHHGFYDDVDNAMSKD